MYYLLNSSMKELNDDYLKKDGDILVSLVTTEECEHMHSQLPFYSILERNMRHHNIQSCKADLLKDCIIGTLRVPDHKFLQENSLSLTFYLSKDLLILVDDARHIRSPEAAAGGRTALHTKYRRIFLPVYRTDDPGRFSFSAGNRTKYE